MAAARLGRGEEGGEEREGEGGRGRPSLRNYVYNKLYSGLSLNENRAYKRGLRRPEI